MPNANLVAARNQLRTLVSIYNSNFDQYQQATYNETQVRVDFVNPFFQLLGWDVLNEAGLPQHLREVTHEATVLVEENGAHRSKKPDYSFKVGTEILFFLETKKDFLHGMGLEEMEANITLDSPIPYSLDKMIDCLTALDQEMVPGARAGAEKKGPYNGQLTRFIQRLETKRKDKRLNFMFSREESLLKYDYMDELCCKLMLPAQNGKKGVKIIDFSEVPSDILPLIVSLIARVVFSVQQWSQVGERHPIAIFCDEAHLYIPAHTEKSIDDASLVTFERISKEGRKYGVGLVVISQRPSEVNRTVLSQSNNFIAMRLTNADDQAVVKRLLPDSLGDYAEMLPILDIGEALIVGDASLLPSRIRIAPPKLKPRSATIDFWDEWAKETSAVNIRNAIEALRKQSK